MPTEPRAPERIRALVDRGHFGGFVDCGRAGLADRHQNLALARRSIAENFGPGWFEHFLEACGAVDLDEGKLSYYCLLDEFF